MFSLKHDSPPTGTPLRPAGGLRRRALGVVEPDNLTIPVCVSRQADHHRQDRDVSDFRDVYARSTFKLDPHNPSPLGDYAKGTSLAPRLTPPGGTELNASIKCDSQYGGALHGVFDLSGQPGDLGTWLLRATDADILPLPSSLRTTVTSGGTLHQRLIPGLISDLIVVSHYSF